MFWGLNSSRRPGKSKNLRRQCHPPAGNPWSLKAGQNNRAGYFPSRGGNVAPMWNSGVSNLQEIPVYLVVEPTPFDNNLMGHLLVLPGTQPPKGAPVVLVACGARLRNRPRSTTSGRHPCHTTINQRFLGKVNTRKGQRPQKNMAILEHFGIKPPPKNINSKLKWDE